MVSMFQNDREHMVFVLSLKVAGTGVLDIRSPIIMIDKV